MRMGNIGRTRDQLENAPELLEFWRNSPHYFSEEIILGVVVRKSVVNLNNYNKS